MPFKAPYMESKNYQDDLSHIRQMMERSSRFISLSGISGVGAGLVALLGAAYVYWALQRNDIDYFEGSANIFSADLLTEIFSAGVIILVLAVFFGYLFTSRKSKKINQPIWNRAAKKMMFDFAVTFLSGVLFCLGLIYHEMFVFIAPATLVFYGLALVNAEKHTLSDIKYLGYCQIVLGLLSMFFLGWGLVFWAIGFGVLHIVYGIVMYRKYK